jgi:hypothetical protein
VAIACIVEPGRGGGEVLVAHGPRELVQHVGDRHGHLVATRDRRKVVAAADRVDRAREQQAGVVDGAHEEGECLVALRCAGGPEGLAVVGGVEPVERVRQRLDLRLVLGRRAHSQPCGLGHVGRRIERAGEGIADVGPHVVGEDDECGDGADDHGHPPRRHVGGHLQLVPAERHRHDEHEQHSGGADGHEPAQQADEREQERDQRRGGDSEGGRCRRGQPDDEDDGADHPGDEVRGEPPLPGSGVVGGDEETGGAEARVDGALLVVEHEQRDRQHHGHGDGRADPAPQADAAGIVDGQGHEVNVPAGEAIPCPRAAIRSRHQG